MAQAAAQALSGASGTRLARNLAIAAALLIGATIAGALVEQTRWGAAPLPTGAVGALHSVLLTNNQVYYGTLERVDQHAVVLTHVFYVQVTSDAKTGERANQLVDRTLNDWHAPISMTIPIDKIIFLEVVGPDSSVAKLITEAKNRSAN